MARVTDLASLRVGFDALRVNPMRTFLSTLGVVIGVASLVAVLSVGDGMQRFARREVTRTSSLQDVFVSPRLADEVDGVAVPRDTFVRFEAADAAAALREIPGAAGAVISAHGATLVALPGDTTERAARVTATLAGAAEFYGVELAAGRFFTEAEAAGGAPVAVVSDGLARLVAPEGPQAALGKQVPLRGGPRAIVGVLAPGADTRGDLAVYVPLSAAAAVLGERDAADPRTMVLRAGRVEDVEAVRAAAERWLARRWGPDNFVLGTDKERGAQVAQAFLMFKLFLGAITAISLLVGGIGIMNVLLASVTERTREIGIRKAVGARRRDIVLQFLSESVAISGSGSLAGLLLGLAGAYAITAVMRGVLDAPLHAAVTGSTLIVAAVSALVVGLTFGTYPALRASRLSPIDAIRHE